MALKATGLRRLFLFDAVCREGGIGQAAASVGLSQPAVSQAINKLENGIGVPLFDRGFAGSDLNFLGEVLQRRVRRMFEQIEQGVSGLFGSAAMSSSVSSICRHLTDAQIRCHIAIAQQGSAVGAARQLGISQPAVHRAARELEQTVGITLYRRRVHSVSANPAGLEFARRLSLALHEISEATDEISSARGLARGRISVGVLPLMPKRLLARAIGRLLQVYPDAAIAIHEGSYSLLLNDLQSGVIDLIVGALRREPLSENVVESALFADPYAVAVRRGHELTMRAQITNEDLSAYDWVVPQKDMPRRAALEEMLATLPRRPRIVMETSSLAMMMAMLVESDCITLLSRANIFGGNYRNDVVALAVGTLETARTVGMTTRADWLATPVQQAFIDQLREQCRQDLQLAK